MRTTYGAFTFALIELKEGISETFSVSELDPPADYGELDIWMEVEQFDIHNEYYNISLNSNLLALTSIRVDIDVPNYTLAGYNYRGKITDDGSITFQLPRVDEEVEKLLNHQDRKSTRLNSSHVASSYAVFCLKK